MAFDSLSEKLQNVFKGLRSKGRLTEDDVKAALKEVKLALLEADVNFKVVKQFVKSVQERAVGEEVLKSLTPGQMVIKIVNEELVKLMTDALINPNIEDNGFSRKDFDLKKQELIDDIDVALVRKEVFY